MKLTKIESYEIQAFAFRVMTGYTALEVQDALADGLAERHGIDGPALVAKLRGLTYAQEVALVDSVEQHWRSSAACAVQMHSIAHTAQRA